MPITFLTNEDKILHYDEQTLTEEQKNQARVNIDAAPDDHTHEAAEVSGLASVATSGSYNDLSDKPTIPAAYTHPATHPASMITGLGSLATKSTVAKTDLASDVQTSLGKADTALQSFTETDPTVPAWAKAASKPSYTASEIGAVPTSRTVNGKALSANITLTASDVGASATGHTHLYDTAVTTAGDGATYTATIDGIAALTAGISFIMIPHVVSTTTAPKLDLNGLGAKMIRRRISNSTTTTVAGSAAGWLGASKPLRVTYDGTYWVADFTRPNATDIYGTMPVTSGGTGYTTIEDTTYTTARYRASALVNAETNPSTNGVINWTYE